MLKRFTDGNFALGLVLGACIALITLLTLDAGKPNSQPSDAASNDGTKSYRENREQTYLDGHSWWHWDGRLVTSSDTAAQWIMMIFTVIAAGLLLGTLIVTQRMARETSRIGEAQVKAYLTIEDAVATPRIKHVSDELVDWLIVVTVRNTGQSPARSVVVDVERPQGELGSGFCPDLASGAEDRMSVSLLTKTDDLHFRKGSDTHIGMFVTVTVRFQDVFCARNEFRIETAEFGEFAHLVDGEATNLTDFSAIARNLGKDELSHN